MKPTKILTESLLSAADRIEFGTDYKWVSMEQCNCGILAQELLLIDGPALMDRLGFRMSWWRRVIDADEFCQRTGLPISEIFKELYKHGLEQKDFQMLENAGFHYGDPEMKLREDPKYVANFFRELAAKLQEQRKVKL